MLDSGGQLATFNFPEVERKEFNHNFLDSVVIELRYPTYLRLKQDEPLEISESIRGEFPNYAQSSEMQVTPLGTTEPQPVYTFATRQNDTKVDITASSLALVTKKYTSFEKFSSRIQFLIEKVIPYVDTSFFTRVGLRFINSVSGMQEGGMDIRDWINGALVSPIAGGNIGTISNMKSELTGQLVRGRYTFRYGLSPAADVARHFILDWDYYDEDVEVNRCMALLNEFHDAHFPFFWWALGEKAKEVLENGSGNS